MSKTAKNSLVIAGAISAAALAVSQTVRFDRIHPSSAGYERCYGVARAGMNECGTPTHSCASQSQVDGDPESWIMVPRGLCDRLIGGKSDIS